MSPFRWLTPCCRSRKKGPKESKGKLPDSPPDAIAIDNRPISKGYGCYVINEDILPPASEILADVVFIHGLTGNRYNTWATDKKFWPRDLLSKEKEMRNVRIITYGYDADIAKVFGQAGHGNLLQQGDELIQGLMNERRTESERARPIIFVCHSLGGLVVKQAMDTSKQVAGRDPYRAAIFCCTYGIIFLGTPHRGPSEKGEMLAGVLTNLAKIITQPNEKLIHDLRSNSTALMTLLRNFAPMINSEIVIHSFIETAPVTNMGLIVSPDTGYLDHQNERIGVLHANHMDMARFESAQDSNYKAVSGAIMIMLDEACKAVKGGRLPKTIRSAFAPKKLIFEVPFDIPYSELPTFKGREDELEQMAKKLLPKNKPPASSKTSIHVITGTGGMGKTQMAVKFAWRHRAEFSSILWVNSMTTVEAHESFLKIAARIVDAQAKEFEQDYEQIRRRLELSSVPYENGNFTATTDSERKIVRDAVRKWLGREEKKSNWLIIFDNYDDDKFPIKDYWPPDTQRGSVIVTSRLPRSASQLPDAGNTELEGLDEDSAISLLLEISKKDPKKDPKDINEEESREFESLKAESRKVVQYIGHMPLAIEHAGAYILAMNYSIAEYIPCYNEAFEDIHNSSPSDNRLGTGSDKRVWTTWKLSVDEIGKRDPEAALFLRMCAFLDPKSIQADIFLAHLAKYKSNKIKSAAADRKIRHWMKELVSFSLAKFANEDGHGCSVTIHRVVHSWAREYMSKTKKLETIGSLSEYLAAFLVQPEMDRQAQKWNPLLDRMAYVHLNTFSGYFEREIEEEVTSEDQEAVQKLLRDAKVLAVVDGMASAFQFYQNNQLALQWNERALISKEKSLGKEDPSTIMTVCRIAIIFGKVKQYSKALEWHERALKVCERTLSKDDPRTFDTVNDMAIIYEQQGEYEKADEWYKRALEGCQNSSERGENHPKTLNIIHNIALLYESQGKCEKALEYYRKALEGKEKTLGKENSSTLETAHNLALLLEEQDQNTEALKLHEWVLEGREKTFGKDHYFTLQTMGLIAHLDYKLGKYAAALERLERVISVDCERRSEDEVTIIRQAQFMTVRVHVRCRAYDEAMAVISENNLLLLDVRDYIGNCDGDGCGEDLVFGWYVCLECGEYELCGACWQKPAVGGHVDHQFAYVGRDEIKNEQY